MPRLLNTAETVWTRLLVGAPDECWPFDGTPSSSGYGQFYFDGRLHTAHVVAWELVNGPVPDRLQLDHTCRNRLCGNPAHLEPVTGLVNVERSPIHNGSKTTCPQGHPYSGNNLYVRASDGGRICRTCNNADSRERKRRRRAALTALGLTTRGTSRKRRLTSPTDPNQRDEQREAS